MRRPHFFLWWSWASKLFGAVAARPGPAPARLPQPSFRGDGPPHLQALERREAAGSLLNLLGGLGAGDDAPALLEPPPPASSAAQGDLDTGMCYDDPLPADEPEAPADPTMAPPSEADLGDSTTPALDAFFASLTLGAPDTQGSLTQAPGALPGPAPIPAEGSGGGPAAPSFSPPSAPGAAAAQAPAPAAGVSNALLPALLGPAAAAAPAAPVPAATPQAPAAPPHAAAATAPPAAAPPAHAPPAPDPPASPSAGDPLYILDVRDGLVVPANTPRDDFSTWGVNLWAQVGGATVSSYSWDLSNATDATSISGTATAHLQFTWANFSGATRSDAVTLTTTNADGSHQTFTLSYQVASTSNPGYTSTPPTSSSTWPAVITPDQLKPGEASVAAGPYADLGLWDGAVHTSYELPAYNPGVAPLSLLYNSATAVPQPVWLVHYQLPTSGAVPAKVTAALTLNGTAAQTTTYVTNQSGYPIVNPGDYLEVALLGINASSLSTGRYSWGITITPSSGTASSYSGSDDIVSQAHAAAGAGWSLGNVSQVYSVSGGVLLVQPGGTSLYFSGPSSGSYSSPAGDFSTLVQNTGGSWTRTLPDGTQQNFNSSGYQTSLVDRLGNTTTFNYSGSNRLTSITDMNGQVTTFAYNGSGKLTNIADPAGRQTTLAFSGSQLTQVTGPDSQAWKYSYSSNNLLTTLTDPLSHTTTFNFTNAAQVSGTTQPDGSAQALTPVQAISLLVPTTGPPPPSGGTPGIGSVLTAAAPASYKVGSGSPPVWTTGLDWLGFGWAVTPADPLIHTWLEQRDANGLGWLAADPLGRATRSLFDSKGNATLVVLPDSSSSRYSYNTFSEVSQYTDPTGGLWTYDYDSLGNLTQALDALGHASSYSYTSKGSVSTLTDPLGHTYTANYDSYNRATSVIDALTHTATLGYDSASDVTVSTDVRGFTSTYGYDALGRVTIETLPVSTGVNAVWSLGYDAAGNNTSLTDPLSHALTYGLDAMNRVTASTDALGHATTFAFDVNSNLTGVTNALNKTWGYLFDSANRLTQETGPLSDVTTLNYDAASEVTSVKDPLSRQWQYGYSVVGLLTGVTDPLGDVLTYGFDAAQFQTAVSESASGYAAHTWTTGYDAAHRVTARTDSLGNQTTYGYDSGNNVTRETDGLGHALTYGFDALNRMTSSTDSLSEQTTIGYDNGGNATSLTDGLGRTSTYSFDGQNRLLTAADPNGGLISYNYDLAGRLTALTDPVGNTTHYGYDNADNETSMTDALSNAATYGFDAANELTSATDRDGRQRTFGYDAEGRETIETWVGGSYNATYQYDAAGQRTLARDGGSQYFSTFDNAGRVSSVDNAGTSGVPHTVLTYGYDGYGNATTLTDSQGGSVSYGFDADHRLTNIATPVTGGNANISFGYDAVSRLTAVTRASPSGDTITTANGFDSVNRLTSILERDSTSSTTLASYSYGYDAASQLTSYSGPEGSLSYGYDPAGQLTSVSGARGETYSYDQNGNRTMSGYVTGTGNELLNDGTYSYSYDKEGNLAGQTQISTGQTTSYSYDYRNRLVEAKVSSSTGLVLNDEQFSYDVNDNRIAVTLNGALQQYTVYDGQNPYLDFNASGSVTQRYLTDPAGLDEFYGRVSAGGTVNWYLTDNLGSVRQIVGTNGSVLDQLTYGTFGGLVTETNSANGDRFKFAAGEYDSVLGTYRFNARSYSPGDGRFLSQDPLSLAPDTNPYRYTLNDPAATADPSGLDPGTATAGAAVAAGAGTGVGATIVIVAVPVVIAGAIVVATNTGGAADKLAQAFVASEAELAASLERGRIAGAAIAAQETLATAQAMAKQAIKEIQKKLRIKIDTKDCCPDSTPPAWWMDEQGRPTKVIAIIGPGTKSLVNKFKGYPPWWGQLPRLPNDASWIRGHLLGCSLGGPAGDLAEPGGQALKNMIPLTRKANEQMAGVESTTITQARRGTCLIYIVEVIYAGNNKYPVQVFIQRIILSQGKAISVREDTISNLP